jgi:putative hydroxymethylpyrimidine transport system permease protein
VRGRKTKGTEGIGGTLLRVAAGLVVVVALWQAVVLVVAPPRFMLPAPLAVAERLWTDAGFLLGQAAITFAEMAFGLLLGGIVGVGSALLVAAFPLAGRAIMPVLLVSQVLPVFAIAPLLVLWLGFGMASKVAMAAIIIYFPVASALVDGLRRTEPGLLELAALAGSGRGRTLFLIRFPSALPSLVSGLRVAAVFAPIGAVIGEWVGASAGLGFVMTQANARMQTDRLFAALVILAVAALLLRALVDLLARPLVAWAEDPA